MTLEELRDRRVRLEPLLCKLCLEFVQSMRLLRYLVGTDPKFTLDADPDPERMPSMMISG